MRGFYWKIYLWCRAYTWALQSESSISPLFPDPWVAGVANDWCIRSGVEDNLGVISLFLNENICCDPSLVPVLMRGHNICLHGDKSKNLETILRNLSYLNLMLTGKRKYTYGDTIVLKQVANHF